jgi:hypothetical protein
VRRQGPTGAFGLANKTLQLHENASAIRTLGDAKPRLGDLYDAVCETFPNEKKRLDWSSFHGFFENLSGYRISAEISQRKLAAAERELEFATAKAMLPPDGIEHTPRYAMSRRSSASRVGYFAKAKDALPGLP